MKDIRDILFADINGRYFEAYLKAEHNGVLSGAEEAVKEAKRLGILLKLHKQEGDSINAGDILGEVKAHPKEMTMAEECIIGTLAKASGIATAAATAVKASNGRVRIVSGSWKKMPPITKNLVRQAVTSGGASFRICDEPMLYMDKNIIRMLGSIPAALEAAKVFKTEVKVIQIRGDDCPIETETEQALEGGAGILMVDTGRISDLQRCIVKAESLQRRSEVKIAFAGGVRIKDIKKLAEYGMDTLCIGKEIVDARLLDMKLDVDPAAGRL